MSLGHESKSETRFASSPEVQDRCHFLVVIAPYVFEPFILSKVHRYVPVTIGSRGVTRWRNSFAMSARSQSHHVLSLRYFMTFTQCGLNDDPSRFTLIHPSTDHLNKRSTDSKLFASAPSRQSVIDDNHGNLRPDLVLGARSAARVGGLTVS
jgi:hypothetical protein